MTETLTGKQVLALLAQDEVPEIEYQMNDTWRELHIHQWNLHSVLVNSYPFRIKPKPARRLSVALANGEVVSWPEPVREALKHGQEYFYISSEGEVSSPRWTNHNLDKELLDFGNVHLTREAAQEHADALHKINTQEVVC